MADHPRPVGTLDCRCGRPAKIFQSHTVKNPNRWFFKCDDCEFFQFADTVPGYPNMPSLQGPQQQQHGTLTQQRNLQQQQPYTSPVRLPRYNESPAGPAAYGSPGGAVFRPQQQQQGYMQQQAWRPPSQQTPPQRSDGPWQQQPLQPWANQQQQQQQQQQQFSPQQPTQPGWQAGPSPQQQQPPHWASPSQYSHCTLGQQLLQQQQPGPNQGYGSQGSGSQGGTQGSQGGGQMQQGSQQQQQPASQWQQQPSSQWQQQQQPSQWQQQQPSLQWQQPEQQQGWLQQPAPQQQGWQPRSPLAQQPYHPPNLTRWQQQSPMQQHWAPHPQYSQQQPAQAYQPPAAGTPNSYQQQQQPFNSPLAPSPMGPLGSGPAGAAASPGQGIVVRVYPAPAEYDKPGYLVLKTAGFQQHFVTSIKELPPSETDRRFHPQGKVWLVLTRAWEQVKTHLESRGFTIKAEQSGADGPQVDPHDMSALENSDARLVPLVSPSVAESVVRDFIPPECWDQLMPQQQVGVLAGVRRGGKLLLADEMGLGKTAQSIILACCYPQHWPLLVICPASLRGVWAAELQAWVTPQLQPEHHLTHNIKTGEALRRLVDAGLPATRNQVLVLTYDLVKKLSPQTAARFGVVICDESHQLKNKDTQRTKAVSNVVRGAAVAVLLTGTPLLSRPIEVWSQVDMLRPGLLGSFDEFGRKYCIPEGQTAAGSSGGGRGYFPGQLYQGCNKARVDELHRLLLANVMVRRTKSQVGLALPTKTRLKVSVALDPATQPRLTSIRSAMQLMADRGEADTPEAKRLINEYRIATGTAKLPAVVDFIQGLPGLRIDEGAVSDHDDEQPQEAASPLVGTKRSAAAVAARSSAAAEAQASAQHGGKILIFGYHQEVLNVLQSELCEKLGIGYIRIDGATQPEIRSSLVHKFQIDPSVRVALLSIKAAGTGLTLTAADRVVFAELHWNPSDLSQAEDRIHRMGQEQHCTIYYCMAANSADELMWGTIVRKLKIVGAAVDGREGSGGSSSQGLGQLQTWSQQVQGSQGGVGSPAGAAAAAAAAAAGAQDGENLNGSQSQQHHQRQVQQQQQGRSQPGLVASEAAAAAADGAGTRRRCLLDQFDAEADAPTRASLLPSSAAVGRPTEATAATAGGSGGAGVSEIIDLTGPSPDDAGPAGSNVVDGDHNSTGSAPDHLTGTALTQEVGLQAADDVDHTLQASLERAGQQRQQGVEGDGAGSQARGDPGTQGSQSTMAVGDQAGDATEVTIKRQRQG